MTKYIDDKGLKRFAGNVDDQINNARYSVLNTKGKPNGIASLDGKGFIPLDQLGNLDMTFFEPVQELPTNDIKKHIYLIKNNKEGEQDTYDEYLYTGDVDGEYDASKWEKLGDFVPTFDLKEYAKKGEGVLTLKMSQTATDGCKIVLDMADGNSKETEIPLASAEILWEEELSTRTAKPWSPTILFKNGLMSGSDKHKLDQIDTEALSQSISSANTAADNTKEAIKKCETATAGAEKVNANLTDDNVVEITDRNGTTKSVSLDDAVKAGSDIARIKESLGSYTERPIITLKATKTNKVISVNGVEVTKAGWNIAEFTAELGNEYLFKPGVIDSNVCIFAECIDKTEVRAIDYQYTYNEDGNIATATATYNGKTYTYSYDYSGSDVVITTQNGNNIPSLPSVYTTTIGSYNVLTRLNADAELPEDGYCRFVSNFQSASSIKMAVSYKANSADLDMKVVRDGMTASMCTQLSKINKKVDSNTANVPDIWLDVCAKKQVALVIDDKTVWIEPHRNYRFENFNSISLLSVSTSTPSSIVRFSFHYNKRWPLTRACFSSRINNNNTALENVTSLDVSGWDTSNVKEMAALFKDCHSVTSLDVSGWDTSNVKEINDIFYGCQSIKTLDVSGFDISKVKSLERFVYNCKSLETIDVSGWDTSSISSFFRMFYYCSSLTSLDLSSFDLTNATNIQEMFYGCKNITNLIFGEGFGRMKDECEVLDLSSLINWKNNPSASLLTLCDRKSNGLGEITIKLSAQTKQVLSEDEITQLTAKGYIIA